MRAAIFREFKQPITIENLPDPSPTDNGVVLQVEATGICRSDWHGWMGHDPDIELPHVPGHELAGTIVELGNDIKHWNIGDRVTLPFVCGCGHCEPCESGNAQVCDHQFQPGFTNWGSFAEYVAIDYAELNLVRLPETMSFDQAASLGCRFITSFRGLVDQGRLKADEFVSIYGCGGVGLSAVLIAKAIGAKVIAIDIDEAKLNLATKLGADFTLNAQQNENLIDEIHELTKGGSHVSMDALGSQETAINSIKSLKKRGRHIQVGLMAGKEAEPSLPMDLVIARELEIIGSHGMQAQRYAAVFHLIESSKIDLNKLIEKRVALEEGVDMLQRMNDFPLSSGIAIINSFA